MPGLPFDALGGPDDRVRLTLDGKEVLVAESYEVKQSILTQPSAFSLRLGWGKVLKDLIAQAPPRTPFELGIGEVPRASGLTDGFEVDQNGTATELTIRGRDALAPLHDAFVGADGTFTDQTYLELVTTALREVGLADRSVLSSNAANRRIMTGAPVVELGPPLSVAEILEEAGTRGTVYHVVQAKLGERWYAFLRRHLDRAGLVLWARADGHFTLSRPNAAQAPAYRILRRRGQLRNEVNVISARFKNETTPRYSEVIVYARGGGRKFGRGKVKGDFVDDEMEAMGYKRPLVIRDAYASSPRGIPRRAGVARGTRPGAGSRRRRRG
jgi:prophage tail gpP-like protein